MPQLICIQVAGRLRVRITSAGYLTHANCYFPRALRVEGRTYTCRENSISLSFSGSKYFYRVSKSGIVINNDTDTHECVTPLRVYTDDSTECTICLTEPKALIFVPCGHFSICSPCNARLITRVCHMCRSTIDHVIIPEQMQ